VSSMSTHPNGIRRRPGWRSALGALLLVGIAPLAGCAPTAAATLAPAFGLSTPVPPAALATLPPAKPAHPADTTAGPSVSIENFNFTSADLTVPAGTTVVWTNHDDVDHTVTASDNSFSSPAIPTDGQFSYTFTTSGTYTYFCAIHPFMSAKVIVQ
jgi:plastocyanin